MTAAKHGFLVYNRCFKMPKGAGAQLPTQADLTPLPALAEGRLADAVFLPRPTTGPWSQMLQGHTPDSGRGGLRDQGLLCGPQWA